MVDPNEVVVELQRLITKKDICRSNRKGGPYDQYAVLITTDETMVTLQAAKMVATKRFTARHIDAAYLLLSYQPGTDDEYPEGRPLVELLLTKPED